MESSTTIVLGGAFTALLSFTIIGASYAQEPYLKWAIAVHEPTFNYAYSIAVDDEGSVYTMGYFADTMDADPGLNEQLLISPGTYYATPCTDIFVQKLDSSGNFIWAVQFGGADFDGVSAPPPWGGVPRFMGGSVSVDHDGNILISGIFYSDTIDLDPGLNVVSAYRFDTTGLPSGRSDYLVVKLDNESNFLWGHTFGGAGMDRVDECVTDGEGNVIIVGEFTDTVDFDPSLSSAIFLSADPAEFGANAEPNLYIQKLDSQGDFLWAKQIGGPSWESPTDVDVDSQGNIYVAGGFEDTVDFNPGSGVYEMIAPSDLSAEQATFLLKLDSDGNFVYAFQIPRHNTAIVTNSPSLTIDRSDNVLLSGLFSDTVDLDPSPNEHLIWPEVSTTELFILKLSPTGDFIWAGQTYAGYFGLDTDSSNAIYAAGSIIGGADVDPGSGVVEIEGSSFGILVLRIDSMGNLVWARSLENNNSGFGSSGFGIAVSESGDVHVVGRISDLIDFNPNLEDTFLLEDPTHQGDAFVLTWGQHNLPVGFKPNGQKSLSVYPNPASDELYIELPLNGFDVKELSIIGSIGQKVFDFPMHQKTIHNNKSLSAELLKVNISSWPTGLYTVIICGDHGTLVKKVVKY